MRITDISSYAHAESRMDTEVAPASELTNMYSVDFSWVFPELAYTKSLAKRIK